MIKNGNSQMPGHFKLAKYAFGDFLKNPVKDIPVIETIKEKLKVFFSLFLLEILIALCCVILIGILVKLHLTTEENHKVVRFIKQGPGWIVFIVAILIAPLAEELLFRLHLRLNEKRIHINILIILSGLTLLFFSVSKVKYIQILILTLGFLITIFYYYNKAKFNQFITYVWNTNYLYVFYISAFGFGISHITNYNFKLIAYLFLPIFILPQLVLGVFCGYIRLRLGFIWGCLFHVFHNSIFIVPFMITTSFPGSNNNSIKIIENSTENVFNDWRITKDTIEFNRLKICKIIPYLLTVDEKYVEYEDSSIANKVLTINFARDAKEHSRGKRSSVFYVLDELQRKYKLRIEQKMIEKEIYQLRVVDSVKLYQFNNNGKDSLTTRGFPVFYDNEIILHNVDLNRIAQTITLNFDKIVLDSSRDHNNFTIKIPKLEFSELTQFMEDQYGIKLYSIKDKVFGYKISASR